MAIGVVGGGVAKCDVCGEMLKLDLANPTPESVRAAAETTGWVSNPDGTLACAGH